MVHAHSLDSFSPNGSITFMIEGAIVGSVSRIKSLPAEDDAYLLCILRAPDRNSPVLD
jgi:hypothetical protein